MLLGGYDLAFRPAIFFWSNQATLRLRYLGTPHFQLIAATPSTMTPQILLLLILLAIAVALFWWERISVGSHRPWSRAGACIYRPGAAGGGISGIWQRYRYHDPWIADPHGRA